MKRFVHEAVNEALKLETALAHCGRAEIASCITRRSRARSKASRAEISTHISVAAGWKNLSPTTPVTAIFHGHAHHGQLEGSTTNETPVYNVSLPLLRERVPERPFRVIEVPVPQPPAA